MPKRHVCPNRCGDEFLTTAHVMQEWKVDGIGNFLEVSQSCLQITYKPHDDNIWSCVKCGANAHKADVTSEGGGNDG